MLGFKGDFEDVWQVKDLGLEDREQGSGMERHWGTGEVVRRQPCGRIARFNQVVKYFTVNGRNRGLNGDFRDWIDLGVLVSLPA